MVRKIISVLNVDNFISAFIGVMITSFIFTQLITNGFVVLRSEVMALGQNIFLFAILFGVIFTIVNMLSLRIKPLRFDRDLFRLGTQFVSLIITSLILSLPILTFAFIAIVASMFVIGRLFRSLGIWKFINMNLRKVGVN